MVKEQKVSMKYYWYGFGAVIAVLVVIGLFLIIKDAVSDNSSSNEEPPNLPSLEESVASNDDEKLVVQDEQSDSSPPNVPQQESPVLESNKLFVGIWRVYSERLFYDEGGGGTALSASGGGATTQKLNLLDNGKWEYGTSSGTWITEQIKNEDWSNWKIDSYGPTRKIVLKGWNNGNASGPIEESSGKIDFIWVLYRVEPPTVSKPGTVNMKFGH